MEAGIYESSRKRVYNANKKYNTYDLSGEYGVGYTHNNKEFWFDKEDFNLIKDYCWNYSGDGYVTTVNDGKTIYLHILVMSPVPDGMKVDHITHLRKGELQTDNRKSNLRYATAAQNSQNRCMQTNNTSGHRGVSKHSGGWFAQIQANRKRYYQWFKTYEEACHWYDAMAEKLHGEFQYKENN